MNQIIPAKKKIFVVMTCIGHDISNNLSQAWMVPDKKN